MTDHHRRTLAFEDIAEVLPEVERLRGAHRTLGRWTLGQICWHLAQSFHGSLDGFDLRRHRIKRFFLARPMFDYTLRYGIPRNYTVDPGIHPPGSIEQDEGIDALTDAINRYLGYEGSLKAHPLFGVMDRSRWNRLHCVHTAHHLSFVV